MHQLGCCRFHMAVLFFRLFYKNIQNKCEKKKENVYIDIYITISGTLFLDDLTGFGLVDVSEERDGLS